MPETIDQVAVARLLAMVGNDPDFVDELVNDYLAEAPRLAAAVRAALDAGDADGIVLPAHTLKGTSANLGGVRVAGIAQRIEERGRAGDLDGVDAMSRGPRGRAHRADGRVRAGASCPVGEPLTSPGAESGRVLVVEDGAVNRKALTRALEVRGHQVHAVLDGVEAMEVLRQRPFDLVLLDIRMPRKDGFETLAEIKADPLLRELPVIVISGVEDTPSIVRCIEMGALDHLPKPFEPALLDARIAAALSAKRLRDLELEYLDQVGRVTKAAETLEADAFDAESLEPVTERTDALGVLAERS